MAKIAGLDEYMEAVFIALEHLEYPPMVTEFAAKDVGESLAGGIVSGFKHELSPMMCAITIWSVTMNYQILPYARRSVKH